MGCCFKGIWSRPVQIEQPNEIIWNAKVLIVGSKQVGKSSLVNCILNEKDIDEREARVWDMTHPKDNFGGYKRELFDEFKKTVNI